MINRVTDPQTKHIHLTVFGTVSGTGTLAKMLKCKFSSHYMSNVFTHCTGRLGLNAY